MRKAAALLLAGAVLGGCGSGSDGGDDGRRDAARAPADFVGLVSEDAFARPGAYRDAQFARQHRAGVRLIRQTFAWPSIETAPGRYDLATYDRFVADAARAGLTVLPILFGTPAWRARPLPDGEDRATPPPRDPVAMGRFAARLVRRYGSDGTLWREQPSLPRKPIRSWQVWNEPNLPVYWGGEPDATEYTRLLRDVGGAIRRADPRAEIVSAGLPESKLGVPFAEYLRKMYASGAQGTFDVLAVNAYSRRVSGMEAALAGARRIMASAEDGDVPIWVTEFGWATRPSSPRSSMTVGPKTQSRLLGDALDMFERQRERLRLRGFVYYAWRDARPYPGGQDFWGLHTGLLTRRGTAKPALRTLRAATEAAAQAR